MDILPLLERTGEAAIGLLPDGPRIALRRNLRRQKERLRLRSADLTVVAHPKSGSTWLRFQLARLYQSKYGLDESIIPKVERLHSLRPEIPRIYMAGYEYMKCIIARPAPAPELRGKACVFLIRNPIDVIVSLYFHIQKHALRERKLFNNWPLDLSTVSMMDFAIQSDWGLMEAINFYNGCLRHADRLGKAHVVRYEDMRNDPAQALSLIARFAGIPLSDAEIGDVVEYTSFDRLREAELQNTFNSNRLHPVDRNDPDSFKVRRAKINGYRDYFAEDQVAVLEDLVENHLDPRAGYSTRKSTIGNRTTEGM